MRTPEQAAALAAYLMGSLETQADHAKRYDAYYSGSVVSEVIRQDYLDVFGMGSDGLPALAPPVANLCRNGVDSLVERLSIEGFRVDVAGSEQSTEVGAPEPGDLLASAVYRFWTDLDLDVMSTVAHTESLVKGTATLLAWPGLDGRAVVSVEDATQMVLHRSPAPPYAVDAALKATVDEWTGLEVWWLYTSKGLFRLNAGGSINGPAMLDTGFGDRGFQALPAALGGQVPAVELAVRPRLLLAPQSDLVDVAPLVDMFNYLLAQMAIAASFGAVPVRTATGIRLPRLRDATGAPVLDPMGNEMIDPRAPIDVRADRLLASESKDANFGLLEGSHLSGFVTALDKLNEQIRLLNGSPEHHSSGAKAGVSGDTLHAAEANIDRRAGRIQAPFGSGWRRSVSQGMRLDGQSLGDRRIAVRWADPKTRVLAQDVDATQKLASIGVPLEVVLSEVLKWDPVTVARAISLVDTNSTRANELIAGAKVAIRDQLTEVPATDVGTGRVGVQPPAALGGVPGGQPGGGRKPA